VVDDSGLCFVPPLAVLGLSRATSVGGPERLSRLTLPPWNDMLSRRPPFSSLRRIPVQWLPLPPQHHGAPPLVSGPIGVLESPSLADGALFSQRSKKFDGTTPTPNDYGPPLFHINVLCAKFFASPLLFRKNIGRVFPSQGPGWTTHPFVSPRRDGRPGPHCSPTLIFPASPPPLLD